MTTYFLEFLILWRFQSLSQGGRYSSAGKRNSGLRTTAQKTVTPRPQSTALHLTNKERLLLRRQALKIKRAPLLSIGNPCNSNFSSPFASLFEGEISGIDYFSLLILKGFSDQKPKVQTHGSAPLQL